VSTSGRSGTFQRLGVSDPWSGGEAGGVADGRARREARLEERLGRYDRALGLRAAMRRQAAVGGARLGAFGGFDVGGLVFPRMIEDAPAAEAQVAATAAPSARPARPYVPARVSSAPWLSPSGASARVRRGQPHRAPVLAPVEQEEASEAATSASAPRALDRVLSRAASAAPPAAVAMNAGLRQTPARASARRVAAARTPEAVARAVLGPAARLFDAELSADQADVALRPAALAQARTQAVGGPPARGLRPVLARSPMAQAMVVAQAPAADPAVDAPAEVQARPAVQPMAARLSASPVRRSARPAPRAPAARRAGPARGALGVAARSAQRGSAEPADAVAAPRVGAPLAAPAPVSSSGAVERQQDATLELRRSASSAPALAPAAGTTVAPRVSTTAPRVAAALDESTVEALEAVQAAPARRTPASAAAAERMVAPAVELEPRAAQIEQREGRFARVAAHAAVAQRPAARPSVAGQRVLSDATLAQPPAPAAAVEAAPEAAPAAAARPSRAAAPRAARPSRVANAADWAARRLDIGRDVPGSSQAQPTAHRRPARAAAPARLATAVAGAAASSAQPSASAPSSASVASRSTAARPGAMSAARSASSDRVAPSSPAKGTPTAPRAARSDRAAAERSPLAEAPALRSAVEHVLDRSVIGAASPGSTLPQPTARAPRLAAPRQSVAPAAIFARAEAPVDAVAPASAAPVTGRAPAAPLSAVAEVRPGRATIAPTGGLLRSAAAPAADLATVSAGRSALRPTAEERAATTASPSVESAAQRPAERALRRLTVAEAAAERSVVPAPAAAARAAAPVGERPLDRAAAALVDAAPKAPARGRDTVSDAVFARSPAETVAEPAAAAPAVQARPSVASVGAPAAARPARAAASSPARSAELEAAPSARSQADRTPADRTLSNRALSEGAAASPEAEGPAAPERRIIRAVVHAAARVGLVLSAQTDLSTAVSRLEAANARVERGERSVVPRPTARPDRAARAQRQSAGPSAIFATPMSPVELQQAEAAPVSAGSPARVPAAATGARRSGAQASPRTSVQRSPGVSRRAALQQRASAAVHASDRSGRSPAVGRSVERSLSELSPTARAAVVSLLRRRSRPSALGYSRLVAGPSAPERFSVAGERAVADEAGGVEVQVRRQVERSRPLDFAEVRTAQELSGPELSRSVRVTSTVRTPFGEVVVPGSTEGLRATQPGVRTGRHLTRSAEGRYMAPRMAAELGLVVRGEAPSAGGDAAAAPSSGTDSVAASSGGRALAAGAARSPSVASRAEGRAGQRLSEGGAPLAPGRSAEGVVARGTDASAPMAPMASTAGSSAAAPGQKSRPAATAGAHLPVAFAARPELGQVLGAVDQGHVERALPVWARRASGEPMARGTGGDFVQSLASARSEEDVVRVIVEQGGALSQVGSSLPKPVIQVIEHIRSEARAELEQRVDAARRPASSEGASLPEPTRTRREARRGQTRDNVQVVKALTGLRSSSGARSNEGVGGDRVMKLARKLQQLIHLADGVGDRDAARRQVRMAEDSAQARSEGQGGAVAGNDAGATKQVDIEALGREVLEMVSRELEMRRERRQEDPDGRNVWW
jgi:hypothetical protein